MKTETDSKEIVILLIVNIASLIISSKFAPLINYKAFILLFIFTIMLTILVAIFMNKDIETALSSLSKDDNWRDIAIEKYALDKNIIKFRVLFYLNLITLILMMTNIVIETRAIQHIYIYLFFVCSFYTLSVIHKYQTIQLDKINYLLDEKKPKV